jgi:hypothetical protein
LPSARKHASTLPSIEAPDVAAELVRATHQLPDPPRGHTLADGVDNANHLVAGHHRLTGVGSQTVHPSTSLWHTPQLCTRSRT